MRVLFSIFFFNVKHLLALLVLIWDGSHNTDDDADDDDDDDDGDDDVQVTDDEIEEAFKMFDRDNSGTINHNEIK